MACLKSFSEKKKELIHCSEMTLQIVLGRKGAFICKQIEEKQNQETSELDSSDGEKEQCENHVK